MSVVVGGRRGRTNHATKELTANMGDPPPAVPTQPYAVGLTTDSVSENVCVFLCVCVCVSVYVCHGEGLGM